MHLVRGRLPLGEFQEVLQGALLVVAGTSEALAQLEVELKD